MVSKESNGESPTSLPDQFDQLSFLFELLSVEDTTYTFLHAKSIKYVKTCSKFVMLCTRLAMKIDMMLTKYILMFMAYSNSVVLLYYPQG